jgi:hypothetical protein
MARAVETKRLKRWRRNGKNDLAKFQSEKEGSIMEGKERKSKLAGAARATSTQVVCRPCFPHITQFNRAFFVVSFISSCVVISLLLPRLEHGVSQEVEAVTGLYIHSHRFPLLYHIGKPQIFF